MKLTRRKLAAAVLAAPVTVMAQTQPAVTQDEELKTARERLRANLAAVASQQVPMAVEPAFQFKA